MRLFNINFLKNKKIILEEQNHNKKYNQYVELGKLVKESRTQNKLAVKELSNISKIPESSINSIENNIEDLRPRDPFLRSILLKLEKCLSLENNTLVGLKIRETNTFEKNKKKMRKKGFETLGKHTAEWIHLSHAASLRERTRRDSTCRSSPKPKPLFEEEPQAPATLRRSANASKRALMTSPG